MKVAKRLLSVCLIAGLMCVILAACSINQVESTVEIYTAEGAGRIWLDTYIAQEAVDAIFPEGSPAAAKAIKDKLVAIGIAEADIVTQVKTNTGSRQMQTGLEDLGGGAYDDIREPKETDLISIIISFSTIEDYNAKMSKIITMYDGQQVNAGEWDASTEDLKPIDFSSTDLQKTPATFNGTTFSAKIASIAKAYENINAFIYTNKDVCEPEVKEEGGYDNSREWISFTAKIGDQVTTFDPKTITDPDTKPLTVDSDLSVTGTPSGVIPPLDEVTEPESSAPESSEPESSAPSSRASTSPSSANVNGDEEDAGVDPLVIGIIIAAVVVVGAVVVVVIMMAKKKGKDETPSGDTGKKEDKE